MQVDSNAVVKMVLMCIVCVIYNEKLRHCRPSPFFGALDRCPFTGYALLLGIFGTSFSILQSLLPQPQSKCLLLLRKRTIGPRWYEKQKNRPSLVQIASSG
jgi:hypothetical protein